MKNAKKKPDRKKQRAAKTPAVKPKQPKARPSVATSAAPRRSVSRHTGATKAQQLAHRLTIAKKICALYSTSRNTLESCCNECGQDYDTVWRWRIAEEEIRNLFEKAAETHRKLWFDGLKEKALNSFERLIGGYDYEETQTTATVMTTPDGKQTVVPTEVKKNKRHIAPNMGAVAMAMRNWHGMRDAVDVNHSGEVGVRQVFRIGGQVLEF